MSWLLQIVLQWTLSTYILSNMAISGYVPRNGPVGSRRSFIFNFLRNLHMVLQSGHANLNSHQKCRCILFAPQPFQHSLFVDFLMMAIIGSMNWHHFIVLIWISLIIIDVGHIFMCFLAICMSLEKWLFRLSTNFYRVGVSIFFFLILNCLSHLYILEINSLLITLFASIFSHSVGCLFICLWFRLLCRSV